MPLSVGSRLGHYDVTALIGEGGMGQVYQATDTKLNRQVVRVSRAPVSVVSSRSLGCEFPLKEEDHEIHA